MVLATPISPAPALLGDMMFYTCECGNTYSTKNAKMCKKCAGKKNSPAKINWPDKTTLVKMVEQHGYSKLAKSLRVSVSSGRKAMSK